MSVRLHLGNNEGHSGPIIAELKETASKALSGIGAGSRRQTMNGGARFLSILRRRSQVFGGFSPSGRRKDQELVELGELGEHLVG